MKADEEPKDAEKLAEEKAYLEMKRTTFTENETIDLPTSVIATIEWTSSAPQYAKIVGDKLEITIPSETMTVNLDGVMRLGEAYTYKRFVLTLEAPAADNVATFDASKLATEHSWTNGTTVTTVEVNGVTLTFYQGDNNQYAPVYNSSAFRVYAKNYFTVSIEGGKKIQKIEITYTGASYVGDCVVNPNPESYLLSGAVGTWTGSATTVTLTNNANGQMRIKSIEVTFGE